MGRLDVRVCGARNLADTQMIGKPDPYCIVKLENQQHKTTVKENTTSPIWDEVFKFTVADPQSSQLRVELWNSNVISDEFLGQYSVALSGLVRGQVEDRWFVLQQSKTNAELHLRIVAVDFGPDPPAGQPPQQCAVQPVVYASPSNPASPFPSPQGYHPVQPNMHHPQGYVQPQQGFPQQQQPYCGYQPPQGYPPPPQPQAYGPPQGYPRQQQQQQGYAPQSPAGYPQPPPAGYPQSPAGYPQPPPAGYPQSPAGYPQSAAGYPQQQPQGYPPQPQGYPQPQIAQGYPPQPQGYPPQVQLQPPPQLQLQPPPLPQAFAVGKCDDGALQRIAMEFEMKPQYLPSLHALLNYDVALVCDDSGSMSLQADDDNPNLTRWAELRQAVQIILRITQAMGKVVDVYFINRGVFRNVTCWQDVAPQFQQPPGGMTNTVRVLQQLWDDRARGGVLQRPLVVHLFTDGHPTNAYGSEDISGFAQWLRCRQAIQNTFFAILLCTDDEEVCNMYRPLEYRVPGRFGWTGPTMGIAGVDVTEDFRGEKRDILSLRGMRYPFSFGDYIAKCLVGVIDPLVHMIDLPQGTSIYYSSGPRRGGGGGGGGGCAQQ